MSKIKRVCYAYEEALNWFELKKRLKLDESLSQKIIDVIYRLNEERIAEFCKENIYQKCRIYTKNKTIRGTIVGVDCFARSVVYGQGLAVKIKTSRGIDGAFHWIMLNVVQRIEILKS
jgi:hypothetical protein